MGSRRAVGPDHEQISTGPPPGAGILTLGGVPIGRPEDAPARLAAELASADVIAAEDTRRVRRLATALDVRLTARLVSYYDEVEARRAAELVDELRAGRNVLLVTDAGMPAISDPGYRLVAAAAAPGNRRTPARRCSSSRRGGSPSPCRNYGGRTATTAPRSSAGS